MALAARDLGHEWIALTDHSPRLTVARGLSAPMIERMIAAVRSQHTDVLGHCTGRLATGRGRRSLGSTARRCSAPAATSASLWRSTAGTSARTRPMTCSAGIGCVFAIDTDAHAPGQLDWLDGGCSRAELFGIGPDRVINARGTSAMTGGTH